MIIFYLAFIFPLAFARKCPPQRPDPECDNETQIFCPGNGTSRFGCPNSAFCIPKIDSDGAQDNDGNPCPMSCPTQCDLGANETMCAGPLENGCFNYSAVYCVPFNNDTKCHGTCSPSCDEETGEKLCNGGINPRDGCPMSDYCAYPTTSYSNNVNCPAVCGRRLRCNRKAGEQKCDNGKDKNGCWLGAYCAVTCASG